MGRTLSWLAAAFVLAVAALTVIIGVNLMPNMARAQKVDTIVPWFLVWGIIAVTVLTAIVLAAFIVSSAGNDEGLPREA